MMTISPGTVTGHAAAGGAIPADVEFLNREMGAFLRQCEEAGLGGVAGTLEAYQEVETDQK